VLLPRKRNDEVTNFFETIEMVEFSAGTKTETTPHNRKPLGVEIEFEKKRKKISKRNVKYTFESEAV
jgi:hypothetical protein